MFRDLQKFFKINSCPYFLEQLAYAWLPAFLGSLMNTFNRMLPPHTAEGLFLWPFINSNTTHLFSPLFPIFHMIILLLLFFFFNTRQSPLPNCRVAYLLLEWNTANAYWKFSWPTSNSTQHSVSFRLQFLTDF